MIYIYEIKYKNLMKYSLIILFMFFVTTSSPQGLSLIFSYDSTLTSFPDSGCTNIVLQYGTDYSLLLLTPPGMRINFECQYFTKIVVSTNGWAVLVPDTTTVVPDDLYHIDLYGHDRLVYYQTPFPIFAPYWDNIATSEFSYNYIGGALWVRWTSMVNNNSNDAAKLFWVKIDGSTGKSEFFYSDTTYNINGTPSASIGIAGLCLNGFHSVGFRSGLPYCDSLTETDDIGFLPHHVHYTFTPYQFYDNCSSAYDLGTITSTCTPHWYRISNCNSPSPGICSTLDPGQIWFKITKPAGTKNVLIKTTPDGTCREAKGTSLEVFDNCGGNILGCATTSTSDSGFAEVILARSNNQEDLFFTVSTDDNAGGWFNLCASTTTLTNIDSKFIDTSNSIFLFPNPAQNLITIKGIVHEIKIYDLIGSLVNDYIIEEYKNEQTIDISMLSPGIYFIQSGIDVKKFVKN